MDPGAHALTRPDKPALIMASTGKTITYADALAHVSPAPTKASRGSR